MFLSNKLNIAEKNRLIMLIITVTFYLYLQIVFLGLLTPKSLECNKILVTSLNQKP